jgi:hypothetical protein
MISLEQLKIWIESKGGVPSTNIEWDVKSINSTHDSDKNLHFYRHPTMNTMWLCSFNRNTTTTDEDYIHTTTISDIISEIRDYLISEI